MASSGRSGAARRRAARTNVVLGLSVLAVFVLMIAASAYVAAHRMAGVRGTLAAGIGAGRSLGAGAGDEAPALLTGAAGLGADDPVTRFAQTRVGQVLYASAGTDDCGRALFDNSTGLSYQAGPIFCGQTSEQVVDEAAGNQRIQSLRRSFQR